jgi:hypothetical protein
MMNKAKDGRKEANRLLKEQKRGLFAPGNMAKGRAIGARAGGLAHKERGTGVCAPGMAARGYLAAGLDKIWDDPVFREAARWRRSPWKARRTTDS